MRLLLNDYEARGLVTAYRNGELDEEGLALLDETLEEYGLTRSDI
jgi:hypothetical protein